MTVPDRGRRPWRLLLVPGIASAIVFAVLVSLGWWQLERKAWKEDLIAAIETRAHGTPGAVVEERDWPSWSGAADEFRRVRLSGVFRHQDEIRLHGLAEERSGRAILGYYVFTPLSRPDGSTVVVNRGFVTPDVLGPDRRVDGQLEGTVTVTGLVRAPEQPGLFLPSNVPSKGEWFVRDIGQMAGSRTLDRVAPFYIDADATANPGGWPKGGQTRLVLKNDHLGYALTWFGLAGTLIGVFAAFAWRWLTADRSRAGEPIVLNDADGSETRQPA